MKINPIPIANNKPKINPIFSKPTCRYKFLIKIMSYIRVCSSYKKNGHKIRIKPKTDLIVDHYVQTNCVQKIVKKRCKGVAIRNNYDVISCDKKDCNHIFYMCLDSITNDQMLVHPESFPIIQRLLDPNYNPNKGVENIINDYLIHNPLSETILGLLLKDNEDYVKPNKKRKI